MNYILVSKRQYGPFAKAPWRPGARFMQTANFTEEEASKLGIPPDLRSGDWIKVGNAYYVPGESERLRAADGNRSGAVPGGRKR